VAKPISLFFADEQSIGPLAALPIGLAKTALATGGCAGSIIGGTLLAAFWD
jgi:hypothetical protein